MSNYFDRFTRRVATDRPTDRKMDRITELRGKLESPHSRSNRSQHFRWPW